MKNHTCSMRTVVLSLVAAVALLPYLAMAQTVGMIVDELNGTAVTFNADTNSVLGSVALTDGDFGDCAITSDGATGFATNFNSSVNVVDVSVTPPVLAGGNNPIGISNPGEDVSITPDDLYVVVADGSAGAPLGIIDIASQTEIGTADITGSDHNSVEVCSDGTVLTTSALLGRVVGASIDGSGAITPSGNFLAFSDPNNTYCAPGNNVGIVIGRSGNNIETFSLPGMTTIDTEAIGGIGLSAAFSADGSVLYVRSVAVVEAFAFDPVSGDIGPQLWSAGVGSVPTYFGIEQMALSPDGTTLYVSGGSVVATLDAATGGELGTLTDELEGPTGICFATGVTVQPVNARFKVTKTFSDGNDAEVDVTLTCNTGLPLEQTFTIAGGDPDGVTFILTNIPEGGADCEVTESGGPAGYTTLLNGGAGCSWEDATPGNYICQITNEADPATYTVFKDWTVFRVGGDVVLGEAVVTIRCDSAIAGEDQADDDYWYKIGSLSDGETLVATVDTTEGPATCSATETIAESGVEQSAVGCGEVSLPAGGSHTCTFTNVVFFEGIPTLSQYGLAVLVLLTLGVGFVGLRRFV